jgi:hypothetical protein
MTSEADPGSPGRRALLVGGLVAAGGAVTLAKGVPSQTMADQGSMAGHDMAAMPPDPNAAPMPG